MSPSSATSSRWPSPTSPSITTRSATCRWIITWPGRSTRRRRGGSWARRRRMIEFFGKAIGRPYPYAKYAQVCMPEFGGGMENISATTMTDQALLDEIAEQEHDFDGLVSHELAHQWFGDLLTCRDWSHLWLNEGFASYFGPLFTEHDRGEDAFRLEMHQDAAGLPLQRPRVSPADRRAPLRVVRRHVRRDDLQQGGLRPAHAARAWSVTTPGGRESAATSPSTSSSWSRPTTSARRWRRPRART